MRGTGLNSRLKRAAFTAAVETGARLIMSIDVRNARSTAAAAKLMTGSEPVRVWELEMQRWAWVYDFSAPGARLTPGDVIDRDLVATISRPLAGPAG